METKELVLNELPELPVFVDILKEIKSTPYGEVELTITTHAGNPVGLVVSSFRHEKFAPGENSKAIERTISVAKHMADTRETGALTFTLVFNEGEIKEVTHQFYDKKKY